MLLWPRVLLDLILEYGADEVRRILCFLWPDVFGSLDLRHSSLTWDDFVALSLVSARCGATSDLDWALRKLSSLRPGKTSGVVKQAVGLASRQGHLEAVERLLVESSVKNWHLCDHVAAVAEAAYGGHPAAVQRLSDACPSHQLRCRLKMRDAATCNYVLGGHSQLAELNFGDMPIPGLSLAAGNRGDVEFIARHEGREDMYKSGILVGAALGGHRHLVERCASTWSERDDNRVPLRYALFMAMRDVVCGIDHANMFGRGLSLAAEGPAPMLRWLVDLAPASVPVCSQVLEWFSHAVSTRDVELLRVVWSLGTVPSQWVDQVVECLSTFDDVDSAERWIRILERECGASSAAVEKALLRIRLSVESCPEGRAVVTSTRAAGKRKRSVRTTSREKPEAGRCA